MTRIECENRLLELAYEMRQVYKQFNPSGDLLTAEMSKDGYISVSDAFFADNPRSIVLDVCGYAFHTVDVTKFSDGTIKHNR